MNTQTVFVEVDPATAAILQRLEKKAKAQGVSLEALLLPLTETHNEGSSELPYYETASPEEWAQAFQKWATGHDPNTPPLSLADVSRDKLNEDRC
jgi:hypothetical protein